MAAKAQALIINHINNSLLVLNNSMMLQALVSQRLAGLQSKSLSQNYKQRRINNLSRRSIVEEVMCEENLKDRSIVAITVRRSRSSLSETQMSPST